MPLRIHGTHNNQFESTKHLTQGLGVYQQQGGTRNDFLLRVATQPAAGKTGSTCECTQPRGSIFGVFGTGCFDPATPCVGFNGRQEGYRAREKVRLLIARKEGELFLNSDHEKRPIVPIFRRSPDTPLWASPVIQAENISKNRNRKRLRVDSGSSRPFHCSLHVALRTSTGSGTDRRPRSKRLVQQQQHTYVRLANNTTKKHTPHVSC